MTIYFYGRLKGAIGSSGWYQSELTEEQVREQYEVWRLQHEKPEWDLILYKDRQFRD